MSFKGIDISTWQKPSSIDYDKISKEIDFVILRVGATGYGKNPPHTNNFFLDAEFENHYREFTKRNVPIGVYWYGGAINTSQVNQEIDLMMKALKGKKIEYPVYYDVEENRNHGTLSKAALTNIVRDWCEKVQAKGYYVGIYASLHWTNAKFDMNSLSKYSLWLAHWGVSKPGKSCGMWQYTSDGKLPGHNGRLDMNIGYVDFKKVITDAGLNHLPGGGDKPTPKPDPKPDPKPTPPPSNGPKFPIGTEVIVSGQLYTNSGATGKGAVIGERRTKVTRYVAGAKAPYNTTGDLGWMTEAQLRAAGSAPTPAPKPSNEVQLNRRELFATSTSTTVVNRLSGTYFYWDNQTINGRRRVTNRKDRIGKDGQVTGWIKV